MPPSAGNSSPQTNPPVPARSDLDTLKRLFPYLWDYKWRVLAALSFMVCAKLGNVGVPLLLKNLVDAMSIKPGNVQALLIVPAALLLGPLLASMVLATSGARVRLPLTPFVFAQGMVGSMIAKMVPISIVGDVVSHWVLFSTGVPVRQIRYSPESNFTDFDCRVS